MPDVQRASWEVAPAQLSAHSPVVEFGPVPLQLCRLLFWTLFCLPFWARCLQRAHALGSCGPIQVQGGDSYSREGEGHLDARDYISQLPLQLGQVT